MQKRHLTYVLGNELWEQNFKSLVKDFIVNVWEVRKQKLYGDDACPNHQSSPGGLGGATGVEGHREGKLYSVCYACRVSGGACNVCVGACTCTCGCKCKCDNVPSYIDTCTCICGSTCGCGCVADGRGTVVAFLLTCLVCTCHAARGNNNIVHHV